MMNFVLDSASLVLSAYIVKNSAVLLKMYENSFEDIPTSSVLFILLGISGIFYFFGRIRGSCRSLIMRARKVRRVKRNKTQYPLEYVENGVFDDLNGLNYLLERTQENERLECGSLLHVSLDGTRAVIDKVLDEEEMKRGCFVRNRSESMITFRITDEMNKYNGYHHYHPSGSMKPTPYDAGNFNVSSRDRTCMPSNWINFLTFNLPGGPEIIGYNRQFTYIPSDDSKRTLVRASPDEIMEYLGRF